MWKSIRRLLVNSSLRERPAGFQAKPPRYIAEDKSAFDEDQDSAGPVKANALEKLSSILQDPAAKETRAMMEGLRTLESRAAKPTGST